MQAHAIIGSYQRSRGAVLVVALILLLGMTILGVSVMDSSSLQAVMSRNSLEAQRLYHTNLNELQAQYEESDDLDRRESIRNGLDDISEALNSGGLSTSESGSGLAMTETGSASDHRNVLTSSPSDSYTQTGYATLTRAGAAPLHSYSLSRFSVMDYEVNMLTKINETVSVSDQTLGFAHAAPLGQE